MVDSKGREGRKGKRMMKGIGVEGEENRILRRSNTYRGGSG